jgi:hypothetical protein
MDHLQRLSRCCRTCDYALSSRQAQAKGWISVPSEEHFFFCCRTRKLLAEPVQNCPHWCASYDGFDALGADHLPES